MCSAARSSTMGEGTAARHWPRRPGKQGEKGHGRDQRHRHHPDPEPMTRVGDGITRKSLPSCVLSSDLADRGLQHRAGERACSKSLRTNSIMPNNWSPTRGCFRAASRAKVVSSRRWRPDPTVQSPRDVGSRRRPPRRRGRRAASPECPRRGRGKTTGGTQPKCRRPPRRPPRPS